jgi:hypothetical protein
MGGIAGMGRIVIEKMGRIGMGGMDWSRKKVRTFFERLSSRRTN